ncbi:MAG: PQ-loop repeat-containing protein [Chloroflexi bacterium]|nr:PQ-loop repeat-containing protein [Chloroflexota bacterium]
MEIIGWVGFALIQTFYLPQIIKIFKSHDVSGLALPSWLILTVSLVFYLIYSVSRHDPVFIAGNAVGALQAMIMIVLILKYRTGKKLAS